MNPCFTYGTKEIKAHQVLFFTHVLKINSSVWYEESRGAEEQAFLLLLLGTK